MGSTPPPHRSANSGRRGEDYQVGNATTGALLPTKVFVGGLSEKTTEYDLRDVFSKWASVVEIQIITDKALSARTPQEPRRYAFVAFQTAEDAKLVLAKYAKSELELDGRRLNVATAFRKVQTFGRRFSPPSSPGTVPQFVAGVPYSNSSPYAGEPIGNFMVPPHQMPMASPGQFAHYYPPTRYAMYPPYPYVMPQYMGDPYQQYFMQQQQQQPMYPLNPANGRGNEGGSPGLLGSTGVHHMNHAALATENNENIQYANQQGMTATRQNWHLGNMNMPAVHLDGQAARQQSGHAMGTHQIPQQGQNQLQHQQGHSPQKSGANQPFPTYVQPNTLAQYMAPYGNNYSYQGPN